MGEAYTVQMHTPSTIINGYVFYTALGCQLRSLLATLALQAVITPLESGTGILSSTHAR